MSLWLALAIFRGILTLIQWSLDMDSSLWLRKKGWLKLPAASNKLYSSILKWSTNLGFTIPDTKKPWFIWVLLMRSPPKWRMVLRNIWCIDIDCVVSYIKPECLVRECVKGVVEVYGSGDIKCHFRTKNNAGGRSGGCLCHFSAFPPSSEEWWGIQFRSIAVYYFLLLDCKHIK